ncbi:MAG: Na(+)/H(+) antiporter subunit C [Phycisphaera sp.]|nr:Na(+)/H(+) antiporter subunit C [Phycisphaera sp.]
MTVLTAILVGLIFACSAYMMLGRELKGVCMGVFLLGHGANLAILASSRSPVGLIPPVLDGSALSRYVDPLPQALILTAIVIGFAVQAFLLTLLVLTWRRQETLELSELAEEQSH